MQGCEPHIIFWSASLSEGFGAVQISSWHRSGRMMRARETLAVGRRRPCVAGDSVASLTQVPAAAVTVLGGDNFRRSTVNQHLLTHFSIWPNTYLPTYMA